MSLYYDAASILQDESQNGSLKSRVYGNTTGLKSQPANIFALISECAKYDTFFREVIENAGLLALEPKLTPLLTLLIVHDHFFAKKGVAAPSGHPLRQSVERHKARLQAEFTKARLRRKCASIEALKKVLTDQKIKDGGVVRTQPRWARINRLKSSLEDQLDSTFKGYETVPDLHKLAEAGSRDKILYLDTTIPDLVALPPDVPLIQSQAYIEGKVILQDKASCFPAYMLMDMESIDAPRIDDVIDGCAAPGNKTTHVASLLASATPTVARTRRSIFACERDPVRSKTLQMMSTKAGANAVTILAKQDFLALDPEDDRFARVTHLLLDPSCSGSGIVGREDIPVLALPADPRVKKSSTASHKSKKRKRVDPDSTNSVQKMPISAADGDEEETREHGVDQERLHKLSNLQSKIVEHALRFPNAVRVTYSTCSIHVEENEAVVGRILQSRAAKDRGWRLLRRDEQVSGMRNWNHRGLKTERTTGMLNEDDLEACIRCNPNDDERTMGFFVCCFTRETQPLIHSLPDEENHNKDDDEWAGFSDGE